MTEKEAYGQAFENGRKLGYEEGKRDAVKHGRWMRARKPITANMECSVCHKEYLLSDHNYCPNCGAKMDGDWNERKAD